MIKVKEYNVVHFQETVVNPDTAERSIKNVLLLYALGADGVVYEMTGGRWLALPIEEANLKRLEQPTKVADLEVEK
jgi:hypothetical protein